MKGKEWGLEIFTRDTNLELDTVICLMAREIEARIPFYNILGKCITNLLSIIVEEDSSTGNRRCN